MRPLVLLQVAKVHIQVVHQGALQNQLLHKSGCH